MKRLTKINKENETLFFSHCPLIPEKCRDFSKYQNLILGTRDTTTLHLQSSVWTECNMGKKDNSAGMSKALYKNQFSEMCDEKGGRGQFCSFKARRKLRIDRHLMLHHGRELCGSQRREREREKLLKRPKVNSHSQQFNSYFNLIIAKTIQVKHTCFKTKCYELSTLTLSCMWDSRLYVHSTSRSCRRGTLRVAYK